MNSAVRAIYRIGYRYLYTGLHQMLKCKGTVNILGKKRRGKGRKRVMGLLLL